MGSDNHEEIFAVANRDSEVSFPRHAHEARSGVRGVSAAGQGGVDPELAAFIEAAIPSVWALEALIVLKRDPEIAWATDDLVAEMRASTTLVTDCIQVLQRAGLVIEQSGSVHYSPASPALADLADALQNAWRERPVAVVNRITARRSDPLKGFADSFRLGGWKA